VTGQEAEFHQTQSNVMWEVETFEFRLIAKLQLIEGYGLRGAAGATLLATELHYEISMWGAGAGCQEERGTKMVLYAPAKISSLYDEEILDIISLIF